MIAADWRFIKAKHQQVVQTLNPEERAFAELESKMEALQAELKQAHSKVHTSEQALNSTLTEVRKRLGSHTYPGYMFAYGDHPTRRRCVRETSRKAQRMVLCSFVLRWSSHSRPCL